MEIKIEPNGQVDKVEIPTCNILGVKIAAINMEWLLNYLDFNIKMLSGEYICVSNVHTTVISYESKEYRSIQNGGVMALPDGGPLSTIGKRQGFTRMERITGPDLMGKVFGDSRFQKYRHYFYGSTKATIDKLERNLCLSYPNIQIVGTYSPPFRSLTEIEDQQVMNAINKARPDFIWVGLGAPKQEKWMAEHAGKVQGLMIGIGAGFDYFAGNISRAPMWMQRHNLEWLYRLIQEPRRLMGRYLKTNIKFLWLIIGRKRI